MIDGIGRMQPVAPALTEPNSRSDAAAPRGNRPSEQESASLQLDGIARELAAAPPVDTARVAALRAAIEAGSYRVDPEKIAAAMIEQAGPGQ